MIYLHPLIRERLDRRKRVAIGLYRFDSTSEERVLNAVDLASEFADVVVVDEGEETERKLIELLEKGRVYSAVRGTARASSLLRLLRKSFSPMRVAVLEDADGYLFLLSPVGVDEGESVREKVMLAGFSRELAEKLGLNAGVAVLAGGRYGDLGRSERVDRTLAEAELVAKLVGGRNYEIKLEEAVREGVVIAPDGISGNLIFRSLCYLGSGREYGAVYFNIPYRLVDTSRSQTSEGFARAIALASVI
ncbi:hypothetical protein [Geoglobus acetivorans]|uniref:Phosphotransacetylase n=1 Tax=Geoglobus acetivorans TaxID=565033 RepID=A0A0A7GDC5_GEOAI|nr:phosphotransacetylase [Geoglobus acetivorans]